MIALRSRLVTSMNFLFGGLSASLEPKILVFFLASRHEFILLLHFYLFLQKSFGIFHLKLFFDILFLFEEYSCENIHGDSLVKAGRY